MASSDREEENSWKKPFNTIWRNPSNIRTIHYFTELTIQLSKDIHSFKESLFLPFGLLRASSWLDWSVCPKSLFHRCVLDILQTIDNDEIKLWTCVLHPLAKTCFDPGFSYNSILISFKLKFDVLWLSFYLLRQDPLLVFSWNQFINSNIPLWAT